MITTKIIKDRVEKFLGYGNIDSDIWFIGMEEGFSGDINDLEKRFKKTDGKSLIDIKRDMDGIEDHMIAFLPNSNIQRTWSKLILILLIFEGEDNIDIDIIKNYQRNKFARIDSNHCSLEFMPLPCKSINKKDWIYNQFGISYLKTRKDYLNNIMPSRINLFKDLINKYNPKVIIFYSFTYLEKYKQIIGCELIKHGNLYYNKINNTLFFVMPHPTAHGYTNKDWLEISNNIKNKYEFKS